MFGKLSNIMNIIQFVRIPVNSTNSEKKLFMVQKKVK